MAGQETKTALIILIVIMGLISFLAKGKNRKVLGTITAMLSILMLAVYSI